MENFTIYTNYIIGTLYVIQIVFQCILYTVCVAMQEARQPAGRCLTIVSRHMVVWKKENMVFMDSYLRAAFMKQNNFCCGHTHHF